MKFAASTVRLALPSFRRSLVWELRLEKENTGLQRGGHPGSISSSIHACTPYIA